MMNSMDNVSNVSNVSNVTNVTNVASSCPVNAGSLCLEEEIEGDSRDGFNNLPNNYKRKC
jgi:hypothetical protein